MTGVAEPVNGYVETSVVSGRRQLGVGGVVDRQVRWG
jgi:hypothetical protein